ncbi:MULTISPECIES: carbohydrate ABC transporter permease [unclassified Paenibacillus]|uniref:carbohydrate ABC transporter permease n=1 Tax=unclassified Paenibacillus TaxID=185978 RepID=UPI0008B0BD5E|nr:MULTISPECIES: sugar ABC transporter permease [unclassified Paenibacillus]QLG41211.1 sugar ABC transporter permease [Paenibacillus sp. E222]SEN35278.1 carbohydrate ABC transporter membrane protein 1, CUT1 family [Paenibacillus sp. OK076]
MSEGQRLNRNTLAKQNRKLVIAPYLFILPNLLIFGTFIVFPSLLGLYYSFHVYDGLNPMKFNGLDNYIKIIGDREFWSTIGRTGIYAAIVVPLIYAAALGIALLLAREIRMRGFFRAVFYWPTMISYIIVGLTWKWIFGDSFGILNHLLTVVGVEPVGFLTSSFWANTAVIIATVWSRAGFFMVIFIAGLQAIPTDYYEAARLDGATGMKVFRYITLPLLKPTSLLVVMLTLIDAFKAFPLMFALTGGGPGKETTYIVQYIYEIGFNRQELGLASAMSVMLFILIGGFSALQFRLSKGGAV